MGDYQWKFAHHVGEPEGTHGEWTRCEVRTKEFTSIALPACSGCLRRPGSQGAAQGGGGGRGDCQAELCPLLCSLAAGDSLGEVEARLWESAIFF